MDRGEEHNEQIVIRVTIKIRILAQKDICITQSNYIAMKVDETIYMFRAI